MKREDWDAEIRVKCNHFECLDDMALALSEFSGDYLFRGEPDFFPQSAPSLYRTIVAPDRSTGVLFSRIDLHDSFVDDSEDDGNNPELSQALSQHYYGKSDSLDITASWQVALAFCMDGRPRKGTVYVATCRIDKINAHRRFNLVDIRDFPRARRPQVQEAYVAVHRPGDFVDLKDADCVKELGITWHLCELNEGDFGKSEMFGIPSLTDLYDASNDPAASHMLRYLDSFIRMNSEREPSYLEELALIRQHLVDNGASSEPTDFETTGLE